MNDTSSIKNEKRKFMKLSVAGTAAAAAGVHTWSKPVIESTILPAHAQTTANIVEIASSLSDFSTLVSLLGNYPDLVELLSGPGPFTVWAPTNSAFAAIEGILAGLNEGEVKAVLAYHVTPGIVSAGAIPPSNPARSVIDGPVSASNGQIFVIDGVLLEP